MPPIPAFPKEFVYGVVALFGEIARFRGRVPFAQSGFVSEATVTANVSGALTAAPPTPPAPGQ